MTDPATSACKRIRQTLGNDRLSTDKMVYAHRILRGVICIDVSNYNALAELYNSPGPVAENTILGLGTDPERLRAMSPTFHAQAPNAASFLLLHVQRSGDVRQAMEFVAALSAAGTDARLHVFEGQGFEGHIQILLRLGVPEYPATVVMDNWLSTHFAASQQA